MKKLSIITINYNNEEGIKKTISSVINQSFEEFEFIIIDGGSSDSSVEIIKQYEDKIFYWTSEADNGIYHAMNKGIDVATGKYLLFLNSGDYLYDNKILKKVFSMNYDFDILYGSIINDYPSGRVEVEYPRENYITFRHFLKSTLPHPSTFIKRNLFNIVGKYNEKQKIVADWAFFMLAIFKNNASIKRIELPISIFDISGISSRNEYRIIDKNERDSFLLLHFKYYLSDYSYLEKLENSFPIKIWKLIKKIMRIFRK